MEAWPKTPASIVVLIGDFVRQISRTNSTSLALAVALVRLRASFRAAEPYC